MGMFSENLKRISLIFISVVIAILITEGLLRLGEWGFYYFQERQNKSQIFQKNININRAKEKDIVILCIGESTTALGRQHSWPSQLQRILNYTQDKKVFHVINKGVPATNTNRIVEELPAYIIKYKPDFVLAMVGINDGYLDSNSILVYEEFVMYFESFSKEPLSDLSRLMPFLSDSRTYGLVRWINDGMKVRLLGKTEDMKIPSEVRENGSKKKLSIYGLRNPNITHLYHKTIKNLNKMIDLTAIKGVNFIFVQYPLRKLDVLRKSIERDVFYISNYENFLELLKQYSYEDIFTDSFANNFGHATAFGNRVIAENVARQLLQILKSRE